MIKGTKNAFTLAEVLITLGIIGVVAAMTMPTLLNSTQGAQYRTGFKKAISVLNQAITMNVALDDYDAGQATSTDTTAGTEASLYNLFKNRMNVTRIGTGDTNDPDGWQDGSGEFTDNAIPKFGNSASDNYTFYFNDGSVLTFDKNAKECTGERSELETNKCFAVIDVNGLKNPNKAVKCDTEDATEETCKVTSPTDIYPVYFEDQAVKPATFAVSAVMYKGK